MTPQLQHLFAQTTPWSLTIGQSVLVIVIAVVALTVLGWVRTVLRLGTTILGCGCLLIFLFLSGTIAAMVMSNGQH